MTTGLLIIICSFIIAIIVRAVLRKRKECMMAKFIPQLIMLVGGLIGAFIFMGGNWE